MRFSVVARSSALAGAALLIASSSAWAQTSKDRWTGFYAGINAGYAWNSGSARLTGDDPNGAGVGSAILNVIADDGGASGEYVPRSLSLGPAGVIGGGQLGYLTRVAPRIALGIEADLQFASADDHASMNATGYPELFRLTTRQNLAWFGTLRGKLGYLISDSLLVYGSGGLAIGKTTIEADLASASGAGWLILGATILDGCRGGEGCLAGSSSGTSTGWALGGGFEWALTNTISVKAEYLRLDLGSDTVRMTTVAPTTGTAFIDATVKHAYDIARVGLNVRF